MQLVIKKEHYEDPVMSSVQRFRPRPHHDLSVLESLLTKLEAAGIEEQTVVGESRIPTGRRVLVEDETTVELEPKEASMLHSILRAAISSRTYERVRELRYLLDPLHEEDRAHQTETFRKAADTEKAALQSEVHALRVECENLRSERARLSREIADRHIQLDREVSS